MYCDTCDYYVQNKNPTLNQVYKTVERNDERENLNCKNTCMN